MKEGVKEGREEHKRLGGWMRVGCVTKPQGIKGKILQLEA